MSCRLAVSPATGIHPSPILAAAASSASLRLPVIYTVAPSFTNAFAVAKPMPLLPPVMTATFPSSRFTEHLLDCNCNLLDFDCDCNQEYSKKFEEWVNCLCLKRQRRGTAARYCGLPAACSARKGLTVWVSPKLRRRPD